jgi:hypothetical protein
MDLNTEETFNKTYDRLMRTGRSHTVWVTANRITETQQWCRANLGKRWSFDNRNGVWGCFWGGPERKSEYRFNFAREEDKIWFILRWL